MTKTCGRVIFFSNDNILLMECAGKMIFKISGKSNKKFVVRNEKNKRRFTMIYKGSRKNIHIIMKDRKRAVLYTVFPEVREKKPQVKIFSGEECILTCNCLNMFVDREMTFTFMGDIRYRLKDTNENTGTDSVYDVIDERDKKSIGRITVKRDEKGIRSFLIGIDDNYYRDYMILFPLCLELCYYKNEG